MWDEGGEWAGEEREVGKGEEDEEEGEGRECWWAKGGNVGRWVGQVRGVEGGGRRKVGGWSWWNGEEIRCVGLERLCWWRRREGREAGGGGK